MKTIRTLAATALLFFHAGGPISLAGDVDETPRQEETEEKDAIPTIDPKTKQLVRDIIEIAKALQEQRSRVDAAEATLQQIPLDARREEHPQYFDYIEAREDLQSKVQMLNKMSEMAVERIGKLGVPKRKAVDNRPNKSE